MHEADEAAAILRALDLAPPLPAATRQHGTPAPATASECAAAFPLEQLARAPSPARTLIAQSVARVEPPADASFRALERAFRLVCASRRRRRRHGHGHDAQDDAQEDEVYALLLRLGLVRGRNWHEKWAAVERALASLAPSSAHARTPPATAASPPLTNRQMTRAPTRELLVERQFALAHSSNDEDEQVVGVPRPASPRRARARSLDNGGATSLRLWDEHAATQHRPKRSSRVRHTTSRSQVPATVAPSASSEPAADTTTVSFSQAARRARSSSSSTTSDAPSLTAVAQQFRRLSLQTLAFARWRSSSDNRSTQLDLIRSARARALLRSSFSLWARAIERVKAKEALGARATQLVRSHRVKATCWWLWRTRLEEQREKRKQDDLAGLAAQARALLDQRLAGAALHVRLSPCLLSHTVNPAERLARQYPYRPGGEGPCNRERHACGT